MIGENAAMPGARRVATRHDGARRRAAQDSSHDKAWDKFLKDYVQICASGGMKSLWMRRGASDLFTGMHDGTGNAVYRHDGKGKPNAWKFQYYLPRDRDEFNIELNAVWNAIKNLEVLMARREEQSDEGESDEEEFHQTMKSEAKKSKAMYIPCCSLDCQ